MIFDLPVNDWPGDQPDDPADEVDIFGDLPDDPPLDDSGIERGFADPAPLSKAHRGFAAGAEVLRHHLKTIQQQPGVYRMLGEDGGVLYVGKAKNLKNRVGSYTQSSRLPNRLQRMVALVRNVEVVVTRTETEALLLEANFIQRFMPPFNVLLRDDKSYPFILITRDHDFPQVAKHRGTKNRKGWYFGPFASGGAVTETVTLLQRGFQLRNCTDSFFAGRHRPCLQYHIKRCTAPCVGKVTKEDYARQVAEALDFLHGRSQDLQKKLAADMQNASDAMDFEHAASLRDRIKVLTGMQARQDINLNGLGDADVVALHQAGGKTAIQIFFYRADRNYGARTYYPSHDKAQTEVEVLTAFLAQFYADKPAPKSIILDRLPDECELLQQALSERMEHKVEITVPKAGPRKRLLDHARKNAEEQLGRKMAESSEQTKLLTRVAELFGLAEPPKRIEVYDNSHIQGSHAVGAMIAAGPEGFLKKTYRKFNIKEASGNDDFAMMEEVLRRRFKRLIEEDPDHTSGMWPDLVLIDGGEGQLGKVKGVMAELGLPDLCIAGVAKGPDRNAGRERFFMPGKEPFSLPMQDPALYYLQRLRDEAHRFAIGTHRAKRIKAIGVSGLEDVPGIGATRKKALLHHFGSAKAVAAAGLTELARTPGISQSVAQRIHDYFRETK